MFVHGVFAKSGVRVRIPHHVSHFLSIFGSVYNYRGSTFVCREYDDGVVFFQCLCTYPLPVADVRFREFSSFDGTYNLLSAFFCRDLCHVFHDYLGTGYDFFDEIMAKFKLLLTLKSRIGGIRMVVVAFKLIFFYASPKFKAHLQFSTQMNQVKYSVSPG